MKYFKFYRIYDCYIPPCYHLFTVPAVFFIQPQLFKEAVDIMFFDKFEVVSHTHMIFRTVSLIEGFESYTWKITALIAKPDKSFSQQIATVTHKGTVPAARQAAGTVLLCKILFVQIVLHRQIIRTVRNSFHREQ